MASSFCVCFLKDLCLAPLLTLLNPATNYFFFSISLSQTIQSLFHMRFRTWRSEERSIKSVLEGTWRSEERSIKSVLEGIWRNEERSIKSVLEGTWRSEERSSKSVFEGTWRSEERSIKSVLEGTWRSEERSSKSVFQGTWRSEERSIKSVLEGTWRSEERSSKSVFEAVWTIRYYPPHPTPPHRHENTRKLAAFYKLPAIYIPTVGASRSQCLSVCPSVGLSVYLSSI